MSVGRARAGGQDLESISAELGKQGRSVLASVAAHRYLTTRQVEAFHFDDLPSRLARARACRRLLVRLLDLRVLGRLDRRVGGVRAGSASYVWTLGPVGDRLLRMQRGEGARRRFHEPSVAFLGHCLAVADTHLLLRGADRAGQLELVAVEPEPDCWRSFMGAGGNTEVLRPDLYVVTGAGDYEHCWFVEVDRGTESLPTIIRKCHQYDAYWRSGIEQERSGTFPRVVWLVLAAARQVKVRAAIARTRNLERELFRVVVPDELISLVAGGAS